jgi:hypothetical protein
MFRRVARVIAFASGIPVANAAWAVELITNGGFESGLVGWTVTSFGAAGCNTDWNVGTPGTATGCVDPGNPPVGTHAAYSSFDGSGRLVYRLRQTVVVPSEVSNARLTWMQAINAFIPSGQPRTFSVNILNPSFVLLGNACTLSVPPPGMTAAWATQSVDVTALFTAHAGQSLMVEFALTVPENFSGPAGFGLDQVSLALSSPVPTPNAWL